MNQVSLGGSEQLVLVWSVGTSDSLSVTVTLLSVELSPLCE